MDNHSNRRRRRQDEEPQTMKRLWTVCVLLMLALPAIAAAEDGAKTAAEGKPTKASPAKTQMVKDKAMEAIAAQTSKVDTSKPNWRLSVPKPTKVAFDTANDYFLRMSTTKGDVVIRFMPDVAPMHVTSFIYLTQLGFYDGLSFHRVISNFMAQGGDPVGNGTGGPGYQYEGEFAASAKHNRPGILSMANAGPGTDGSQFFLTFKETPWLDGKHTVFGEVAEGMDVVKKLEAAGSQSGRTSEPLKIVKATIEVKAKG
jgi:cyclophilin family peptidyl-prolyl cis-trans isomerase